MEERHTLLIRLAGPMQAWGTQSRFSHRDTGREPSKSGVIGLLCAALGIPKTQPLDDRLLKLRLGVRVDWEGRVERDYQTARGCVRANGSPNKDAVLSDRFYLADASFLVGLEGGPEDQMLLRQACKALDEPVWHLYLGRKAFVPSEPLVFENCLRDLPLEEALRKPPWRPPEPLRTRIEKKRPQDLRVVIERPYGTQGCQIRQDQPYADSFKSRRFGLRYVETQYFKLGDDVPVEEVSACTSRN